MAKRLRWIRLSALVLLLLSGAQGVVWGECGVCQVCRERMRITLAYYYCGGAHDEEGFMCCEPDPYGPQTFCSLAGAACYGINVGGGDGGGTGGGGGGGCSYQNGWCPAECYSCSGGGYAN